MAADSAAAERAWTDLLNIEKDGPLAARLSYTRKGISQKGRLHYSLPDRER